MMLGLGDKGASARPAGFTLVELMAAMVIAAMLLAATVPASVRFYESIQYRQAVRDVINLLGSARYLAVNSGSAQDVIIDPRSGQLQLNDERRQLPEGINLVVRTAQEVNRDDKGVIRFYPEGGSSGGDLDLERPGADATRVSVDWLMGGVSHARYALD
jgi:general secretion pathway protein H